MDDIETYFLCAGCQTAESVAHYLAAFLQTAKKTIDISIYSFHLCPDTRNIVVSALRERQDAGVQVRITYDGRQGKDTLQGTGSDYCDINTPTFVASLNFPCRSVTGYQALMHHKYIVIDGDTPNARIWTGSLNWTDDAWNLQENNVIVVHSQELAKYYLHDFNELWVDGNLAPSGTMDSGEDTVQYGGHPAHVLLNFSPGEGEWIDEAIANQIDRTTHKATLAFVVLTSSRIIKAIQGLMQRNVAIEGIYDETQMQGVLYQWGLVPANNWKIPAFQEIVKYGHLIGKKSTPYTDTSKHDYMHNKVMVLDDVVITGSYNFSRHAQRNAENSLVITSQPLARTYLDYIGSIMDKYRSQGSDVPEPVVEPVSAEAVG